MRKFVLTATLTIALTATTNVHAAMTVDQPSGSVFRDWIRTPITRIAKTIKRAIASLELPTDPIPKP